MSTIDTQTLRVLSAAQATGPAPSTKSDTVQAAAAPAVPAAPEDDAPKAVEETLQVVAKQIESYLRSVGRSLEFRVDSATGRTVVSVRDTETGELIRQIPGEETMRLARSLGIQPNSLLDLTA